MRSEDPFGPRLGGAPSFSFMTWFRLYDLSEPEYQMPEVQRGR